MKDLEFHVGQEGIHDAQIFSSFDKAAAHAVSLACSHGRPMMIDVVTWTKAAARAWQGDSGVEVYNEDPDASIHERIVVRAETLGRIA